MTARATPRRAPGRLFGVIGVVVVLIAAAIGWIAFRANSGLPLESRYRVHVLVPDAQRLIDSADVRIGGVLVGRVLSINAVPGDGDPVHARLTLALAKSVGRLPDDSTVQIRPSSVLGLTYVDISLGRSRLTIARGGTLPLTRALATSSVSDLFQIFDKSAGRHFQASVSETAYALAGRGAAINTMISALADQMPALADVARTLAARATELPRFINGVDVLFSALSPVDDELTGAISNGATTFGALVSARGSLGAAIAEAPGAEAATTVAFRRARPALAGLARLSIALRGAGRVLPSTLRQANATLRDGVPALRALPPFSRTLQRTLIRLRVLARDSNTVNSLRKLRDIIGPTNSVLSQFTPAQVSCNVFGIWSQTLASAFGSMDGGDISLGHAMISTIGGNGEMLQNKQPSSNVAMNPIPQEDASQCQSGNETYTGEQQLTGPTTPTSKTTRSTVPPPGVAALARSAGLLSHIPGDTP